MQAGTNEIISSAPEQPEQDAHTPHCTDVTETGSLTATSVAAEPDSLTATPPLPLTEEEEPTTDPFMSDLAVLKARQALAEAKKSAGIETDEDIVRLKARQALAEARSTALPSSAAFSHEDLDHQLKAAHPQADGQFFTSARTIQPGQTDNPLAKVLQISSSGCAVLGGVLLSSNTALSKYGFIFLACSSFQLFFSSYMLKDKSLMAYGASLFVFVDAVGIYRWLLVGG